MVVVLSTMSVVASEVGTLPTLHVVLEDNPNYLVYQKMERIVERMRSPDTGLPMRTVKKVMSRVQDVFTAQDLVHWIITHLDVSDVNETLVMANRMADYGYFFPIDDHALPVKNDGSFYRFQTPYFYPSNSWAPENTDYAVYLCKRSLQHKPRILADYESENLARLQRMFSRKWEYILMQAEAQNKSDRKRDKSERKILEAQERAFWNVHRPPPGCVNTTELDIKKACRANKFNVRPDNPSDEAALRQRLSKAVRNLRCRIDKCTIRVSTCAETYLDFFAFHSEFDAFLTSTSPWLSDSADVWEQSQTSQQLSESRMRRWTFSCWNLLRDPAGHAHFMSFLEKEYATENLLFVEAVWHMKKLPQKDVAEACQRIWKQFLAPGAEMLVNVDCKTHKITKDNMKRPDRWTFDDAAAHLYYLMTSDSYSRYLRASDYKDAVENARKRAAASANRSFALPKLTTARLNNLVATNSNTSALY